MYAIIETAGKQYRVSEGDVITTEKLNLEDGEKVTFDKVMLISDGSDVKIGSPYIDGAKVSGEVTETGKSDKVIVFKYKAKKNYRKKQGHRQPYTKVKIESLSTDSSGETASSEEVDSLDEADSSEENEE